MVLLHGLTAFLLDEKDHGGGEQFIMHHIRDQVLIPLPKVFGLDLSITKAVLMMWIAALVLVILLPLLLRRWSPVPRGAPNFFEAIVVYLREEILRPYLGEQSPRYSPYLLTAFFFILTCNLLGLVPLGSTATSNISVTATMAILTFIMVQVSGIRQHGLLGYFRGLIPPGLPLFLLPIMIPVEFIGMFTKHFALAIRLFANMTAGHVVIFTLLSLIFTFKNWLVAPFPVAGMVFVSVLEVLIALIQAYIFTILSAVFIGMAIHQEH